MRRTLPIALAALTGLASAGCDGGGGGATDPLEVTLGETTFVVVVNPVVNDATELGLPAPGPQRAGVEVIDEATEVGGPTSSEGVAVIPLPDAGDRRLALAGDGAGGVLPQPIVFQDLVEVAVALPAGEEEPPALMRRIRYAFGAEVVELTPEMGIDAVNDALAQSNRIVLLGGGTYVGDVVFAGSEVTLFGAGETGGEVVIDGDVTVSGSRNRIRGARITGALEVSGSEASVSFSEIDGATQIPGSGVTLLQNRFCGAVDVAGSGVAALGNHGMAPLPADGC